MNRWVSRGCRSVALLVILLPCLVFLFACGGGGGGGDDSKNATITGTVSGTRVTVFDQNNIQAASVVASGNPKSFSVSLPAGTYRFYLIENEGTDNQRVFPLYATGALTTNKFQIPSEANINLGFVNTLSGNAIPANNPLDSGATSAGTDTSIPSSLSASIATMSDVQGTWYVFGLTARSDKPGWFYGTQTFGSDGVLTAGSTTDSTSPNTTHTSTPAGATLSVDPSGILFSTDSSISQQNRFNGILDQAREIIPGSTTFTIADGNSPGVIVGPALLTFLKESAFAVSDLAGYWTAFALVFGSSATNSGWIWGDLEISPGGLASFPFNAHSSAVPDFTMLDETFAASSVNGHAWLESSVAPFVLSFRGALNPGKSIMMGVSELSNYGGLTGHALRMAVRKTTNCSLADLAGSWRIYTLGLGDGGSTSLPGWTRAIMTIDNSGKVTPGPGILSSGTASGDPPGTALGILSINSAKGIVTSSTNTTFLGALSNDKAVLVGTMTNQDEGHSLTIWVK